jgi:hypothetical protein
LSISRIGTLSRLISRLFRLRTEPLLQVLTQALRGAAEISRRRI